MPENQDVMVYNIYVYKKKTTVHCINISIDHHNKIMLNIENIYILYIVLSFYEICLFRKLINKMVS